VWGKPLLRRVFLHLARSGGEARNLPWAPGGTYNQILTALSVGAGGNVTGGAGQLVQAAAANWAQQQVAGAIGTRADLGELDPVSAAALHALAACGGHSTRTLEPMLRMLASEPSRVWARRAVVNLGLWAGSVAGGDPLHPVQIARPEFLEPVGDIQHQWSYAGRFGGMVLTGAASEVLLPAKAATAYSPFELTAAEGAGVGAEAAGGRQVLYHYTNEAGVAGIAENNSLNPSLWRVGTKDVRYGNGQYVSDIAPGTRTPSELSRDFLDQPFQGRRFTHYVEIDASGLGAVQGRPGVYVIPNETPLDLTGRLLSSGKVPGK
jgi:hypothetical protein